MRLQGLDIKGLGFEYERPPSLAQMSHAKIGTMSPQSTLAHMRSYAGISSIHGERFTHSALLTFQRSSIFAEQISCHSDHLVHLADLCSCWRCQLCQEHFQRVAGCIFFCPCFSFLGRFLSATVH